MKTKTWAGVLLAVTCGAAVFAGQQDGALDVYWIDSEGGGSTLIVTPNDESVLIDTGFPGGRDAGRIAAAAKAAGLAKIDYVLLTHFHTDHFGGGAELAQLLPIGTIFERAIPEGDPDGRPTSTFQVQIKPWREIAAKRERLAAGASVPLRRREGGPTLELICLAADRTVVPPTEEQAKTKNPLAGWMPARAEDRSDNANSAVFLLKFGEFRLFHGGDLTWNIEEKLVVPHNVIGKVDVYQVSHHGQHDSNHPALVHSIAPTVTVMNNGPRKGGQLGTFVALRGPNSVEARYQLHKAMGVPAEENAPEEFIANVEEVRPADQCPANLIKMSVAPDGTSYTVSIPATGHSRRYRTRGR